ncbi:CD109 antigen-like [Lampris incognitus]|uniref:CD109 antigen-like n=1 Tax=Lampris incognitus TaxID=2546036 RepID=UPI0024B570CB|nr:CD109 antigen-like [Lampris incognitus]
MRPLYLISGPEVLHAETPTLLAVSILSDFPVRVKAQVTHGKSNITLVEDTFPGGDAGIFSTYMFEISGSYMTELSFVTLVVKGYQGDKLLFANTTTLGVNPTTIDAFIQTDKSRYRPTETVRIRVVSVQPDNHPYKGRVEITVRDPKRKAVQSWVTMGSYLGIVSKEFTLSQRPPLGQWVITTTVNGQADEKAFIVEHYELPRFEVHINSAPEVLAGDDVSGTVRAQHHSGKPVQGTLSVSVTLVASLYNGGKPFNLNQTKEIYGSAQFFFSKDNLLALHKYGSVRKHMADDSSVVMTITASVTEVLTGFKVNRRVEVQVMENTFQLTFFNFPQVLKPSLRFSTKLRISRYDRRPLSTLDLRSSVSVEVTQKTQKTDAEPTTKKLPVPEDGIVHIGFTLQDTVEMLFIKATFKSAEEFLRLYNNYSSPSGSYIQIQKISPLPAQIGQPLQIDVESSFQPSELHYVVSSRGQVVAAGTKTSSSSFSLTPTMSWTPEAHVTVFSVLADGEVTDDAALVPMHEQNYVFLNWSSDKVRPGEQVSLNVTVREPGSQVGILVVEGGVDDPVDNQDLQEEKESNIMVMTDAKLHKNQQPDEPEIGNSKRGFTQREKNWGMDVDCTATWLWLDTNVSDSTWTTLQVTVPDSITTLRAVALVMSEKLGFGLTTVPQRLTVSRDFSLSMDVPSYLIRGEELVLEVNIFNHLRAAMEVILLVAQNEAYEFVLAKERDISVVNARKITVGSQGAASALFPIRLLALGKVEISVDAISAEVSENLIRTVLVKPEGVEQTFSKTLFLELAPMRRNNSRTVSFSFPPDVVPGSQRAHVAVVGDILAFSIGNLDSLVQIPHSCGEQNMIHFAPSIYILQYLDKTPENNEELRTRTLGYMIEAYQRELSYQRDDGSFSAFGSSDSSGSTWLTAFVVRCLLQAQSFIEVEHSVLSRAIGWLWSNQGPQGEFTEVGRVIHSELAGTLNEGPVTITAFVLLALLEEQTYGDLYPTNVSLARRYLESSVFGGVVSNYTLCLAAYALALANSPVAGTALAELSRRADNEDGVLMWRSSDVLDPDEWQPPSVQIEMASYVLLALYRRGNVVEGIPLMKWLSKQRNHLGGYGTTQDTVVALQALACYAAFSGADTIDLRLKLSMLASNSVSHFSINSSTYLTYQGQEVDAEKDLLIDVYMEGRGFALLQMNVFYNLGGGAPSQRLHHAADHEAFSLSLHVLHDERDHNHMLLSICTRLLDNQGLSQTGMAMLDVGMLSGFVLAPEAAPMDLIRKVEASPGKVSLYLDSVTTSEVCVKLPLIRNFKVAHVRDAVVQIYDYYEPRRRAVRTYNSDMLRSMNSCTFCGRECKRCGAGIAISVSSTFNFMTETMIDIVAHVDDNHVLLPFTREFSTCARRTRTCRGVAAIAHKLTMATPRSKFDEELRQIEDMLERLEVELLREKNDATRKKMTRGGGADGGRAPRGSEFATDAGRSRSTLISSPAAAHPLPTAAIISPVTVTTSLTNATTTPAPPANAMLPSPRIFKLPPYAGITALEPYLAQVKQAAMYHRWSTRDTAVHVALALEGNALQVELAPVARPTTAFAIGQGLWQFRVMPFGLCNAPATFERLMERVLAHIPRNRRNQITSLRENSLPQVGLIKVESFTANTPTS